MGRVEKPIDYAAIEAEMRDNPDNWYSPEISRLRSDGLLKRMTGQPTSPEEDAALALGGKRGR